MDNLEIKYIPTRDLIPYAQNARTHSEAQINQIAKSILEFGFNNPVLTDEHGGVIAGHGRILAAEKIQMDDVPVVKLAHLSDEDKRAYILADNKLAMNAGWDEELLAIELGDLASVDDFDVLLTGFSQDEIDELLQVNTIEGLTDPDVVPDAPDAPVTRLGDVWLMGNHRLMCGDSTSIDAVERLMDGQQADMVFTDPPYNTGMKEKSDASASTWLTHFFNDAYTDQEWEDFMSSFCSMYYAHMKDNTVAYICLDWRRNHELTPHIKRHFELSNVIVWDKMVHGLGSDYKYTYEVINVCKKGKPEMDTHQGDREYSDVWHIQRQMGRNKDHATAKPVAIVERCLRHASKPNSLCLDLFVGSGTTLIACEGLARVSYSMELSEQYCDVTVKRWQDFTGKQATLEATGQTFEDVSNETRAKTSTH